MMIPSAVFGDHNATESTFDFIGQQQSTNGLPVNDITLLRMAEFYRKNVRTVFWVNSYPLMGAQAIIEDESWLNKHPSERWIPYNKMPQKRGFFQKEFWRNLTERQTQIITENYFQMVEYIKGEVAPDFIILPISAYIFDRVLGLNLGIYTRLIEYAWRQVDLSPLDSLSNTEAFTEKNTLTERAYRLIEPKINELIP